MAETVTDIAQSDDLEVDNAGLNFEQNGQLLKIATRGLTVQDYVKRLQESDILIAVDGKQYLDGPQNFRELFKKDAEEQSEWLLTFWRDGQVFDILVNSPVESRFGLATEQETQWALDDFKNHIIADFTSYRNYEVYRDRKNTCDILSLEKDPLAMWFPVLWCLKFRLLPPLTALIVCYGVAGFVNFYLFLITYFVLSRFVYLSQINILRSFTLYEDKTHYMTIAATNEKDVAEIVRKIDRTNKIRYERHVIKSRQKSPKIIEKSNVVS